MAVELFNDGSHIVHAFYDLVDDSASGAVQCNQFLIVDNGHGALIDPGGNMTYSGLLMDMQRYFSSKDLDYIPASHADPDILASVNKWFVASSCKVMISSLWTRFVPHLTTGKDNTHRILGIPDQGTVDSSVTAGCWRCRRIFCMPKAISSFTTRYRKSSFRGISAPP